MFEKLRELAEKATPGPWFSASCGTENCWCGTVVNVQGSTSTSDAVIIPGSTSMNDAAYIAAVDPQTVLGLLDELEDGKLARGAAIAEIKAADQLERMLLDTKSESERLQAELAEAKRLLTRCRKHHSMNEWSYSRLEWTPTELALEIDAALTPTQQSNPAPVQDAASP